MLPVLICSTCRLSLPAAACRARAGAPGAQILRLAAKWVFLSQEDVIRTRLHTNGMHFFDFSAIFLERIAGARPRTGSSCGRDGLPAAGPLNAGSFLAIRLEASEPDGGAGMSGGVAEKSRVDLSASWGLKRKTRIVAWRRTRFTACAPFAAAAVGMGSALEPGSGRIGSRSCRSEPHGGILKDPQSP
jgi:hypothetical protein